MTPPDQDDYDIWTDEQAGSRITAIIVCLIVGTGIMVGGVLWGWLGCTS